MLILLPVDGSDLALDAVRHALHLVEQGLQASFVVANVQEAPHLYEVVLAHDPETLEGAAESAGHHAMQSAVAMLHRAHQTCTTEIGHGDPARVLVDIAERQGCDAIILGSGHAGVVSPGRLGSVALAVLHHAAVPVTIVRHPEPEVADD